MGLADIISEKTKIPLSIVVSLLGLAAAGALSVGGAHVRLSSVEDAHARTATKVETLEERTSSTATDQALLRQDLAAIRDTLREIRSDVKDLAASGVRPARGGR